MLRTYGSGEKPEDRLTVPYVGAARQFGSPPEYTVLPVAGAGELLAQDASAVTSATTHKAPMGPLRMTPPVVAEFRERSRVSMHDGPGKDKRRK
jgi:hypothetical protein